MTRRTALGLDLGSTLIKAGLLDPAGELARVESAPAPGLRGKHTTREGDTQEYLARALSMLDALARELPRNSPLGISCQRSSFVLWNRSSGEPLGPFVSWQDRRAAAWCARHAELSDAVSQRSGLPLSAHYIGPKLAAMQESAPELRAALHGGELLCGTLESFLIWRQTSGRIHETDLSMAARSSLLDLESEDWSAELLGFFDVPRQILPELRPTAGRTTRLAAGLSLTASVADQAAGALAVLPDTQSVLINLGTGGFLLRRCASSAERLPGYLCAPIRGGANGATLYVLEGAIGGAGAALAPFGRGPLLLPAADPTPEAFCLPDIAGLGSPHWRPELGLTFADAAARLEDPDRRRLVLEGILFRVCEILQDLAGSAPPERIILSGGLGGQPGVAQALAALLDRPVELLAEREATLTGAARLAAGLEPFADPRTELITAGTGGGYLAEKYAAWKRWMAGLLS